MRRKTAASLVAGLILISVALLAGAADAAQSPARIVFERSSFNSELGQLVSMLPNGADQKILLSSREGGLASPTYSPDGHHIAYARYLHSGSFEIFVMKANGHHSRQLTHSVQDAELDGSPAFAPNGRRIAYDSNRGTGSTGGHIFTVSTKGGQSKQLTFGSGDDKSPSYSPDGSQIVFSRRQAGSESICVVGSHGGQVQCLAQVPNSTSASGADPSFSPDGTEIVFAGIEAGSIDLVGADGSGLRELTKGYSPDFSSSDEIVFVAGEGSSYGLYTMHSDGTSQTVIASGENKYELNGPSW